MESDTARFVVELDQGLKRCVSFTGADVDDKARVFANTCLGKSLQWKEVQEKVWEAQYADRTIRVVRVFVPCGGAANLKQQRVFA